MQGVRIKQYNNSSIGQNFGAVEQVNVYNPPDERIQISRAAAIVCQPAEKRIENPLTTEQAEVLFRQARAAGWLDAQNQPQELSRARVAMLADHIGHLLDLPQDRRWQPFEELWGRRNMRADLQKALKASYYADFAKALNQRITI